MSIKETELKSILESLIMASARPISVDKLLEVFAETERPDRKTLNKALAALATDYEGKSVELKEVSSGYRFQIRKDYADWVSRLWEEKPARYSRALLETLALIAYKQPITRGEIEKIRGVSVSAQIMKTLQEREWVNVVGHRDVPGRPAIYATTKEFLDYFNLTSLEELPTLAEIRDLDKIADELDLPMPEEDATEAGLDEATEAENIAAKDLNASAVVNLEVDQDEDNKVDVAEAMTAEQ
jgi:segregation and condensation protein B